MSSTRNADRKTSTRVVVFDFDGTLTQFDSLLPFLRFSAGRAAFVFNWIRLTPELARFVCGGISNHEFKNRTLRVFLDGTEVAALQETGKKFALEVLPRLLEPAAMRQLAHHQAQRDRILIASASLEFYLAPWAERLGIEGVLGTRLSVTGGKVSGGIDGANCYGIEKLRRLQAHLPDLSRHDVVVYGDSQGDAALYGAANERHHRKFSAPNWSWRNLRRLVSMLQILR
jgi:HAD superfamily hydrolase (TIGR01490 family)